MLDLVVAGSPEERVLVVSPLALALDVGGHPGEQVADQAAVVGPEPEGGQLAEVVLEQGGLPAEDRGDVVGGPADPQEGDQPVDDLVEVAALHGEVVDGPRT